jgi:lycopene cyclase domain-containing protein
MFWHVARTYEILQRSKNNLQKKISKTMSLYLLIIIASFVGPFLLSFDKKVYFYKRWKYLFPSILIVAVLFIIWDNYFTDKEIWGFNPEHLQGIYFGNLPIEECLFFFVVPYACIFIYEVLNAYFPKIRLKKTAHYFAFGFTTFGLLFGITFIENWYTSSALILSSLFTIGFYYVKKVAWYPQFIFAFLVTTLPFLIVNGILTGIATNEPIVWYHEEHIMGLRIFTIPLEDVFYNYSMLLPITAIYEFLKSKFAQA